MDRYSIVFQPPELVLNEIKAMKAVLAEKIGWYHSKNSLGHITICEFETTEEPLVIIKRKLKRICATIDAVDVVLNNFNSYPNGAFFIAPDATSTLSLKTIMKEVTTELGLKNSYKSNAPHLSIGRKLSEEQLQMANQLFTTIHLTFIAKGLVLRKLDTTKKQFEAIDYFPFEGNSHLKPVQGVLF
ncbi:MULTISPECIES: 2'-5' RNA ligase family protein [Flavobacterium]|uniref:2'-5' RNA ligase family protein n=1 Tax=Flavobacterium jumunjinense TaxID=998845 RepID=A0ABV5GK97_9FLAO|nr:MULTISPECIES: 2'-5' RNA ligase family protein [Flavobacterium]